MSPRSRSSTTLPRSRSASATGGSGGIQTPSPNTATNVPTAMSALSTYTSGAAPRTRLLDGLTPVTPTLPGSKQKTRSIWTDTSISGVVSRAGSQRFLRSLMLRRRSGGRSVKVRLRGMSTTSVMCWFICQLLVSLLFFFRCFPDLTLSVSCLM